MNTIVQKNRNILIAVDESNNAKRAVLYVKDLLAGLSGFHITIATIIPRPPEDYFITEQEKNVWIEKQNRSAERVLEDYRRIFIQAGFAEEDIVSHLVMKECTSLAECILEELKNFRAGQLSLVAAVYQGKRNSCSEAPRIRSCTQPKTALFGLSNRTGRMRRLIERGAGIKCATKRVNCITEPLIDRLSADVPALEKWDNTLLSFLNV